VLGGVYHLRLVGGGSGPAGRWFAVRDCYDRLFDFCAPKPVLMVFSVCLNSYSGSLPSPVLPPCSEPRSPLTLSFSALIFSFFPSLAFWGGRVSLFCLHAAVPGDIVFPVFFFGVTAPAISCSIQPLIIPPSRLVPPLPPALYTSLSARRGISRYVHRPTLDFTVIIDGPSGNV